MHLMCEELEKSVEKGDLTLRWEPKMGGQRLRCLAMSGARPPKR